MIILKLLRLIQYIVMAPAILFYRLVAGEPKNGSIDHTKFGDNY